MAIIPTALEMNIGRNENFVISELQKNASAKRWENVATDKYIDDNLIRKTSLVVVDQFPKPGEEVPMGTPVTLTFIAKDVVDVGDIYDLSDKFRNTYSGKQVKDVITQVENNDNMKKILEDSKKYADLNESEKNMAKQFAQEQGVLDETADPDAVKTIYNDYLLLFAN